MKTLIVLASLLGLATTYIQYTAADTAKQARVLSLLGEVNQPSITNDEYYKTDIEYDFEENTDNYTNANVVAEFLVFKENGFMPKNEVFSIFYEHLIEETIAIFNLFYYAKDFDTFYKNAVYGRINLNPGQFLYTFYIAVLQRPDTQGLVLPDPYEINPDLFLNIDTKNKLNYVKNRGGIPISGSINSGLVKENNKYVYYANYSSSFVFNSEEQRLTYFTEDIGLNSYYFWFHAQIPFWWNGNKFGPFKKRLGEYACFFYEQLLIRYKFERVTNGLGPIPGLSWLSPISPGYYPLLTVSSYPFAQRPNLYNVHSYEENFEDITFLDSYEQSFLQFLQNERFNASSDQEVDFLDSRMLNCIGNYWLFNANSLKKNSTRSYQRSYEATARRLLGAAPRSVDNLNKQKLDSHEAGAKYSSLPSALDFYQTSINDPVFFQMYNKIISYINQYKKKLPPHTTESLAFPGVQIEDVEVERLVTFFEFSEFNADNAVFFSEDELQSPNPNSYAVRQPRINHRSFSMNITARSTAQQTAAIKVYINPKYDDNFRPTTVIEKIYNSYLLDWFTQDLVVGENEITRNSNDFFFFREDSVSSDVLVEMLEEEGTVPLDMADNFDCRPNRLMLPKGTTDGFPIELFVIAYPYTAPAKMYEPFKKYMLDNKPYSYPFNRPVYSSSYYKQPNILTKDLFIYHEGENYPY